MLITDRSATLCAQALPLELVSIVAEAIAQGYEKALSSGHKRIRSISPLANLVQSDLTYSRQNVEWYVEYYKELQDIARISKLVEIPDIKISSIHIKKNADFHLNPLCIHSPVYDEYYKELYDAHRDSYDKAKDTIVVSRMMLTDMDPDFDDFVKGVPVWLSAIRNVLITAYDMVNRRHIRITQEGRRYRYFTAIISDNWQEILDVPPEMDVVVNYLISNRANLALVNE